MELPRAFVVIGTRPEAIKLAPVVRALSAAGQLRPVVCTTGQHHRLLDGALAHFGLSAERRIGAIIHAQSPADVIAASAGPLVEAIGEVGPAVVIVQGDTASAFAGALAAFYARVPLAHVEAGLRTGDLAAPFPEEGHRRLIARLAATHFVPTSRARDDLLREGVRPRDIVLTGNTGIDALRLTAAQIDRSLLLRERYRRRFGFLRGSRALVLATMHRRENHGAPLERICTALQLLARMAEVDIVVPVHPNPAVFGPVRAALSGCDGIHLVEPLDYGECVWMTRRARLVLTDSGGLQEEAPTLGTPVLVLRDSTERPEGVAAGVAALVGTDPARIAGAALAVLRDATVAGWMGRPLALYGDGRSAERIAQALALRFCPASPARSRPGRRATAVTAQAS